MRRRRTNPPIPVVRCWFITFYIYVLAILANSDYVWWVKLAIFTAALTGGNILIERLWVRAVDADDAIWRAEIKRWADENLVPNPPGREQAPWN